jgi:integrase
MKVNFILKNKNNPTKIYCRFKPSQIYDFTSVTPLVINREDWNPRQQQIRQKSESKNKDLVNKTLKKLESKIIDDWLMDTIEKKNISNDWLKNIVKNFFGQTHVDELYKIYFLAWIQKFIDESSKRIYKGKSISPLTIKQYQTTLNKLKSFESVKKIKIKFNNLDLKFYDDFVYYCKVDEKLANNSIGGHIKNIKMWCRNIEIQGFGINQQYKHHSFATISNPTYDIYFKEEEVNLIFNHDFSSSERLSNARDLFVIGLRTGLRISDFTRLEELNIKENRIRIITHKTNASVVIPLEKDVKAILKSNKGKLPRTISEQKFNLYIKEIALAVGFTEKVFGAKLNSETSRKETGYFEKWELVTSHICRRTFATLLYGKLPNKVIMAITTHTTENQLLKYIKTSNEEYANILEEYWDSENKIKNLT